MHASVIIPTKNAGRILEDVLQAVRDQVTAFPFEVLVIDSGSSDGTVELVCNNPGVRLVQIQPETFGHGRTRNLGVELTSGTFVAFLTHDAIPADAYWLSKLVGAVEQSSQIAGAFGRHVAHLDAGVFVKRDIERHFAGFMEHPLVLSRETDPDRYAADIGWRQLLHYYSDNSSCLRRSVWETIPYPDVEFAEDQIWAKMVIEAGYAKAFAPDAVVRHSHDYNTLSQLRRAFDESNAFRELFGYRLSSGPLAMVRSFAGLSRRDLQFTKQQGIGFAPAIRQIACNGAVVAGHFLGAYAHHLPVWLSSRLSHDKKLFNNLGTATKRI